MIRSLLWQFEFQTLLKNTLAGFGLNEIITYSLVDEKIDQSFQLDEEVKNIAIENPLSPELAVLRTNLIAGTLLSARHNLNRGVNDIKLFQIGHVYPSEKSELAICVSGARSDNWQDKARPADFYYLKGITESLFEKIGIGSYEISPLENRIFSSGESAEIKINNETIGIFGRVKKDLLKKIDIDKDCYMCQIDLEKLYSHARLEKRFSPVPKFPAVYRDISTLAAEDVLSGHIVDVIKEASAGLVKEIKLFDVYRGEQIPKGKKSLVYRLTYQSQDKTLTDSEVEAVHSRITASLKEKLSVDTR